MNVGIDLHSIDNEKARQRQAALTGGYMSETNGTPFERKRYTQEDRFTIVYSGYTEGNVYKLDIDDGSEVPKFIDQEGRKDCFHVDNLVKQEPTESKPAFKVGDRVRVVRPTSVFSGSMHALIGNEYTIKKLSGDFVDLKDSPYTFSTESLELVTQYEQEYSNEPQIIHEPKIQGYEIDKVWVEDNPDTDWTKYNLTETGDITMTAINAQEVIATQVNVFGSNAANLTDDQIFDAISKVEAEITRLKGISSKSSKVNARVKEMKEQLQALVDYVDARD